MRSVALRLLASILVAAAIPGMAVAATVSSYRVSAQRWVLHYTSLPGEADRVTVTDESSWTVTTLNPPALTAGTGCTTAQPQVRVNCSSSQSLVVVLDLNDGDDRATLDYSGRPAEFDGGAGNDRLDVTVGANVGRIDALGGPGSDTLSGGPAADVFDGGEGDDLFRLLGADTVTGGPGVDTVTFSGTTQVVHATLDGQANDGSANQRAALDVENVIGGDGDDQLAGDAGANRLAGGPGKDLIVGHGGPDVLVGDAGNDHVDARDGVADTIDCGFDNDVAIVDVLDTTTGCETVQLPDVDGDGVNASLDCDDTNAAVKPGAADVPGNGVDEDCLGGDASITAISTPTPDPTPTPGGGGGTTTPPPIVKAPARIVAPVSIGWDVKKRYTLLTRLVVRELPVGARIAMTCRGQGCPKKATVRPTVSTADLSKRFSRRRLAPGARIEIRVLADYSIGKVVTVTIRRGKDPSLLTRCLPPGAARPQRCS